MTIEHSCIFTIVSKNYLHYAINLMNSVAEFAPDARRVVVICDRLEGLSTAELPFETVELEELNIPHLDKLLFQYSILELNTAIKPFVFQHIFSSSAHKNVIYFDPDIQLFSSANPLLEELTNNNIILTPHLTDFVSDDKNPSEVAILQSGTYNLGFLALARSDSSLKLVNWWGEKLLHHCIVDIPNGLFTDQKWMDLVPGIFSDSKIVRHPGWNVAYWNLAHRNVTKKDQLFYVNDQALFFFHFSGLDKNSQSISKHQDRFVRTDLTTACRELFDIYQANVEDCGQDNYSKLPYAFSAFESGLKVPNVCRPHLRTTLNWSKALPDLRSKEGETFITELLNKPIDGREPLITQLAFEVHARRADLVAAFPDILDAHRVAYADWFCNNAQEQEGIDPFFSERINVSIGQATSTPSASNQPAPSKISFTKIVYKLAWKLRFIARPFLDAEKRNKVRMSLLNNAYKPNPSTRDSQTKSKATLGANVIGYLQAESGVGESARSMLRALNSVELPHAVVHYNVGNASRQTESFDNSKEKGAQYDINLFHINADQMGVAAAAIDQRVFANRYCIGYWAWELEEFPDAWLSSFVHLDEIWVPSTFCQKAIAAKSPVPVVCIPHTVIIPSNSNCDRMKFGLKPDTTCFLSMADMFSIPERKNPLGAIEAFIEAFETREDVELIVKISNSDQRPEISSRIREYAQQYANIHLLDTYLSREDIYCLLDSVDCFISLHRSEGFGLVIAEAMAREKVVVATGWSGNMEFMNNGNSMVVDYTLVELDADYGPYAKGQIWAEPNISDAAEKLRRVAGDKHLRSNIGKRARLDCQTHLSDITIGAKVVQRLSNIYKRL